MRRHGLEYAGLPPPTRHAYEERARTWALVKEEQLSNEVKRCIEECDAEHQHSMLEEAEMPTSGGRLRDHRLSDKELQELSLRCLHSSVTVQEARESRDKALQSPEAPDQAGQTKLLRHAPAPGPKHKVPAFVKTICKSRELFSQCALTLSLADGQSQQFLFLFAQQSPYALVVQPLKPRQAPSVQFSLDTQWISAMEYPDKVLDEDWTFDGQTVNLASPDWQGDATEVMVVPDTFMYDARHCGSFSDACFLEDFVEGFEETGAGRKEPKEKKARKARPDQAVLAAHPWLRDALELRDDAVPERPRARPAASSSTPYHARAIPDDADQDVLERASAELREKQLELEGTLEDNTEHFATSIRGGRWTQAVLSVPFDCFAAQAKSKVAKAFCQHHGLPVMQSYSMARYGEDGASKLALAWTHRMNWLFTQCGRQPEAPLPSLEEWQSYVESDDFQGYLEALPQQNVAWQRVNAMRRLGLPG